MKRLGYETSGARMIVISWLHERTVWQRCSSRTSRCHIITAPVHPLSAIDRANGTSQCVRRHRQLHIQSPRAIPPAPRMPPTAYIQFHPHRHVRNGGETILWGWILILKVIRLGA